jgi:hypothetical protein
MRLPRFDLRQRKNPVDLGQHIVQVNRVSPEGYNAGLRIELLKAVTCRHPYHCVRGAEQAPQIVAVFGSFEPFLHAFVEVLEVISKVGVSERRIVRHPEAVSQRGSFRFLAASVTPKEFRKVGGGDQETLKGDKSAIDVLCYKGCIDVVRSDRSGLALKGHLALEDSENEGLHGRRRFVAHLGRSRFLLRSVFKRASRSLLGTAKMRFTNSSNLARAAFWSGLLLANGILPDELTVGDPLADDAGSGRGEARRLRNLAAIEPRRGLGQVAVQVLGVDRVVGPVDHPLEQGPDVLQSVRVDSVLDVPLGVVDDSVDVLRVQPFVGEEGIGVNGGAWSDACPDHALQGPLTPALDDLGPHLRRLAPLQQAHGDGLARGAGPDVLAPVLVLELRQPPR